MDSGDIIISTALASRGTDIKVSNTVQNLNGGGLHVLLTYLPRNSRVERQIIGRTGRKGLQGSFRMILCKDILMLEGFGDDLDYSSESEIKRKRDFIEATRVENLKETLKDILFKEDLFKTFCEHLKKFETSFKPTLQEKLLNEKKDEFSKSNLIKLVSHLKKSGRQLDLDPCKQALKEMWAIWFSEQSIDSCTVQEQKDMTKALEELMKAEGKRLLEGKCQNFYHKISGAMTRSITFDEIDPSFLASTWDVIDASLIGPDKKAFGSAICYQRLEE